jgi:tryptophan-rich sensory protein
MKLNYFVIPIIILLVAVLGSSLTSNGMKWYQTLKLSAITPPGSFIGMVWTIIFILSAISLIIFWNKAPHNQIFWIIISIFIINGVLNIVWSFLFFSQHLFLASIIEMLILAATVLALIVLIWPISLISAILLIPYAGWVIFATYVAWSVWQLNK